jgi:hypothetical protein
VANKKEKTINGKKVTVIIEDPNEKNYTIDISNYSGPTPGEYPSFTLLGGVANIKITESSEKEKTNGQDDKVKFKKITIEVDYDVEEKNMELAYYHDEVWKSFKADKVKVKTKLDKNKKKGKVEFKDFVLDPPVGWGFL